MDETKHTILRAAAHCLATRGVRGLRMADVKQAAGVSSGLLYYHFTDRDGLLAATLAYINASAAEGRAATAQRGMTNARWCLLDNLAAELVDDREVRDNSIAWNEITASSVFDETLAGHLATSTNDWQQRVAADVRCAQADGDIAAGVDADHFASVATTLVDGLSERWLTGRLSASAARDLLRVTLSTLLDHPPAMGAGPASGAPEGAS